MRILEREGVYACVCMRMYRKEMPCVLHVRMLRHEDFRERRCVFACMYVCMYVYMYVCMYVCMCVCVCMCEDVEA